MSKSRAKGTQFESSLVPFLRTLDPRAERSALKGFRDSGDFIPLQVIKPINEHESEVSWLVVSAKNEKRVDLSGYLREVEKQRVNGKADYGVVVMKRRGTTEPAAQYCLLTLGTLLQMLGAKA